MSSKAWSKVPAKMMARSGFSSLYCVSIFCFFSCGLLAGGAFLEAFTAVFTIVLILFRSSLVKERLRVS